MTDAGGAAAASSGHDPSHLEPQAEELLRFAKQRKKDANARHRARKKAVQADPDSWQTAIQRQLEAERRRLAELHCEEAALNSMAAYQQEAMQVLEFANFSDRMGGEVTFLGAAAAAASTAAAAGDPAAAADTAAAAENGGGEKDWVALFAANLVPMEQVEDSADPLREQDAAQHAQQTAQQTAAAAGGGDTTADAYFSSRSGSGGSSGGEGSGGSASGATTADAARAAATPASPAAHSSAAAPRGWPARGAQQGGAASARARAFAAATATDSASAGGAARDSTRAQQPAMGADEFLNQMNLGPADRGLMDLLMQEQRVVKHWYFAGSAVVRASIVRMVCMALSVLPVSVISQRNKAYMAQLQHTVQRWEACPGSRRQIEEILGARLVDRQVLMRHLAHKRPKVLLEVWAGVTCPPPPPGTPSIGGRPPLHPMLLPIAQYLESTLTPHKMAQLERDWHQYQKAMGVAVEMRVQASARLQYAAAVQALSWQKQSMLPKGGSSAERSKAYCTMADSTGCLNTLETRELIALLDLQEALMRVLSPIQMARVFMASFPYNPDMTRICPWLFARPPPQQQHHHQQQHLPFNGAPGHFLAPMPPPPAFALPGQEVGPAVPAGSQVHSMPGVVPVGAADVAGADLAPSAADLASADLAPECQGGAAGLEPGGCPDPDSLLDLLNDDELDFLIADLAGDDEGHFLAASSPRLP